MAQGNFSLLQSIESKESLREAGLHIEDAWAIRFSAGDAEGHFVQSAAGIDGVVVAENKVLTCGTRFLRPPSDAELVTANFLDNSFDACVAFVPFRGENVAAEVSWLFFEARRFREDKPLKRGKHLRQTRFQSAQEFIRVIGVGHGRDMLTMTGSRSNGASAKCGNRRISSARIGGTTRQERVARLTWARI